MHELTISKATRGSLGEAVARARFAGERTRILVRGRPAAVLVSLADLERLEAQTRAALAGQEGRQE